MATSVGGIVVGAVVGSVVGAVVVSSATVDSAMIVAVITGMFVIVLPQAERKIIIANILLIKRYFFINIPPYWIV